MLTWISVRKPDTKPDCCQKNIFSKKIKKNTKQTKNPVTPTNRELLISDNYVLRVQTAIEVGVNKNLMHHN